MSLKKLSEADKNEILRLYRETEATTSTLAEQFEVSSSTVSRFLKGSIPLPEYEELIQRKRLARTPSRRSEKTEVEEQLDLTEQEGQRVLIITTDKVTKPLFEKKNNQSQQKIDQESSLFDLFKQESVTKKQPPENLTPINQVEQLPLLALESEQEEDEEANVEILTLEQLLGEDIGDLEGEYEEDEEEEDDDEEIEDILTKASFSDDYSLEILPLSQARFPKVCYLVIDRQAELITKPLREFRELGKIPLKEVQEQTLPIFDNHKIARRFSSRREKVIKVPDSSLLEKTASYLQAKGITRILLDGQVYTLD